VAICPSNVSDQNAAAPRPALGLQWLQRWLGQLGRPRESTRRGYASHVRLYLAPYLGRVLLAELAARQVQAMFTAIARQHAAAGRPVSAATLTRVKATLRAALNAAVRAGYLAGHPATYISCRRRAGPGRRCGRRSGSRRGKRPGSGRPWRCGPPRRPRRS